MTYFPTVTGEIAFATAPLATPTWEDISAYILSGSCRRGRPNEQTRIEAGQMAWLLENVDRRFDPTYTGGPYSPNVVPTRKARLRALAPGFGAALTVSGNEITDALRALGVQGDGLAADSSYGVWEATTNLENSAGADVSFESGTAGYTTGGTNTIASSAEQFKFGAKSCKATYQDNATLLDIALTLTAAAQSASRWLYIPAAYDGGGISVQFANYAGATGTLAVAANMALRDQWQRVEVPNVVVAGGDLIGNVQVVNTGAAPTAGRFVYIVGCQTETQPLCTPFTIGPRAAARVQAPASLLNATQGWVAMRMRMGFTSTASPATADIGAFRWAGAGANVISVSWREVSASWDVRREDTTASLQLLVADSFSRNDTVTLIYKWTASRIDISIDGAAFTGQANTEAPTLGANFDIGSGDGTGGHIDSDFLWFACGTGTLTDADAAVIGGWDDATAGLTSTLAQLGTAAAPTMFWHADDATPIVPTTHSLFTGYADRWPQEWEMPSYAEVPITFSDAFELLAAADIGAGTAWPAELSGARLGRVLDAVSWPAGDRVLDAGQVTIVETTINTDDGTKALGHLQDVADSELMGGGVLFIDGQGRVVFHDKHHRLKPASVYTPLATFGDNGWPEIDYEDLVPDYDKDRITNDWRITPSGGAVIKVEDSASITNHFRRTQRRTPLVADVNECQSQAEYLTALTKSPLLRFDRIDFAPSHLADGRLADYTWANIMGREIGDRIRVKKRPPGGGSAISQDCHIEGISHAFTDQEWRTTWLLSPADPLTYWILGDATYSLLGQTAVMAP